MTETTPTASAPWGDHPLPERGQVVRLDFGPLALWLRRVQNELWLAWKRTDEGLIPEGTELPPDVDWRRWALEDRPHRVRLLPALPDRMLVVKTEQPFTLLRKAEARVFTRIGAWVRVEAVDEQKGTAVRLTEIPTEIHSDTWWGDFADGEIAYWLSTKARREVSDSLFQPHLIMAVLHLTNRSADDLPVEKLALRVEHLSIYEIDGRLWAEETRVDYQGEDLGSDIRMDDKPPREAGEAREITPARAQTRGFRARTFARLRALSSFGSGG